MTFGGDYALTTAHAAKFRQQGAWHVDIAGIQRGDIVFFDWGGSDVKSRIDHVGIVTGADAGGIYTIEGNYSDVCDRHVRYANWIAGYGRPRMRVARWECASGSSRSPERRSSSWGAQPDHRGDARPADGGGLQRLRDADRQGRLGTGDVRSYAMWQTQVRVQRSTPTGSPGGPRRTACGCRGPEPRAQIGGLWPSEGLTTLPRQRGRAEARQPRSRPVCG